MRKCYCVDCHKLLHKKAYYKKTKRCFKCEIKTRNCFGKYNNHYKHGKSKNNKCIKCGKHISFMATRCRKCSRTPELKLRLRNLNLGHKTTQSARRKMSIAKKHSKRWKEFVKNIDYRGEKNPMYGVHRYGKKNPNWLGGISKLPYLFDFDKKLKEFIRKRDKYKCQLCQITKSQELKRTNRQLTVHHIDYCKQNSKRNNLITLCIGCNFKVNYNRDYWYAYFTYKRSLHV